jgi:hypothetical protein
VVAAGQAVLQTVEPAPKHHGAQSFRVQQASILSTWHRSPVGVQVVAWLTDSKVTENTKANNTNNITTITRIGVNTVILGYSHLPYKHVGYSQGSSGLGLVPHNFSRKVLYCKCSLEQEVSPTNAHASQLPWKAKLASSGTYYPYQSILGFSLFFIQYFLFILPFNLFNTHGSSHPLMKCSN